MVVAAAFVVAASEVSEDSDLLQDNSSDQAISSEEEIDGDDDMEDMTEVRVARAADSKPRRRNKGASKNKVCRYTKGDWSECDTANNQRTRTLTLKKGDTSCQTTKTINKKCKKVGAGRRNKNN